VNERDTRFTPTVAARGTGVRGKRALCKKLFSPPYVPSTFDGRGTVIAVPLRAVSLELIRCIIAIRHTAFPRARQGYVQGA